MPYISSSRRANLNAVRPQGGMNPLHPTNKGELNYVMAREVNNYLARLPREPGYQDLSDAAGACEDLAAEIRRRFLEPYEDEKIAANGDVFTFNQVRSGT